MINLSFVVHLTADTENPMKFKLSEALDNSKYPSQDSTRVGDKKRSSCRTAVAKLSSCKMKEKILVEARKQRPPCIQIYENFSKAAVQIHKEI